MEPALMSQQVERSPPPEPHEHQKATMPATKMMMMKTLRSTVPL
jgi:hypothetical protein